MTDVRSRAALAITVLAALVAAASGCGGADVPAVTTARHTTPRPLDGCRSAGGGWQALPTSGYYSPPAAHLGRGRVGVVFANDSNNDSCAWSGEARSLAAHGHAVAVFETVGNASYEAQQVLAVTRALRRTGVQRIALIGASVGARAVLQAGARHPGGVVGIVALSAERRIMSNQGDLLPIGRRVRVPVLSVGSRGDPLTSFGKDTRAWHRTIPDGRALILSGSDHGVDLLTDRHGPRVRSAIRAFLRSL